MQESGSGATSPAAIFTAPITGYYALEADLTVESVTGTGNMGLVVASAGVFGSSAIAEAGHNSNTKGGLLVFLPKAAVVTTKLDKPVGISNSPNWTYVLRVRLVGGSDLTQED